MSVKIQILLMIGSVLFFFILLKIIKKGKMTTDLACLWIVLALVLMILAFFPELAIKFGYLVGVISSINAIFLVLIFLLLCLLFYLFMKVTLLEKKLNDMIQRYALDESEKKEAEKL
ncbi:MAG: DUF2304 domain-containing protein [Erysipelotrichaceae bacterium]|nr:DUF2304 domain-containing protein [Erysipelotrichaceae bacterium]MDY5252437.1 DUF2304 domain-containing protein [Erysipelotrichaceae bacterium]